MIAVRLMGGLGNQLFQYAAGYAVAKDLGVSLSVDKRFFQINNQHGGFRLTKLKINDLTSLPENSAFVEWKIKLINQAPYLGRIIDKNIIHESTFSSCNTIPDNSLLLGYWQAHKYFSKYLDDFKKIFQPLNVSESVAEKCQKISAANSVSVHIRRGDYVNNKVALANHGVCSVDYYKVAIKHILANVDNPSFFIFSDDIAWAEENITEFFKGQDYFFMKGNSQEDDLWLMSNAKFHIIANSSFSWWGAYLASSTKQIVVAPTPWFDLPQKYTSDPSLPDWVRINK